MLELLLTSQLPQNKPDVFQHGRAPQHIHNEVTMFLNQTIVWVTARPRVSASCRPLPPDLTPPDFCVGGFVEDEVYLTPKPVPWTTWRNDYKQRVQRVNVLRCKMFCTKSEIAVTFAGQQTEHHTLHLAQGVKGVSSVVFYKAARFIVLWLALSYQQIYVIALITCDHLSVIPLDSSIA